MSSYTLHSFDERDDLSFTHQVANLYRKVEDDLTCSDEQYSEWWQWCHVKNPCHNPYGVFAQDSQGKVIGHCAAMPFSYLENQERKTAGFICQLMVDEAFRKQLVFPQMELKLTKQAPEHGFDFLYGLINRPQVLKAHLAFGFQEVESIPVWARPVCLTGCGK